MKKEELISDLNKIYSAVCSLELKGEQNILTRYNVMSYLHQMISIVDSEDTKDKGDDNINPI